MSQISQYNIILPRHRKLFYDEFLFVLVSLILESIYRIYQTQKNFQRIDGNLRAILFQFWKLKYAGEGEAKTNVSIFSLM